MAKTVAAKMGIAQGMRAIFIDAPASAIEAIDPPELQLRAGLSGTFDYIHLFVTNQAALQQQFSKLKEHLQLAGALWVSWPKGKQEGTDLSLPIVIKIGYDHGLVESKTLSIDATWSAIKFTYPKRRKVYQNKYGRLKE